MSSDTTNDLFGVWGSSSSDVFVVGDYGTISHYPEATSAPSSITPVNLNQGSPGQTLDVTITGTYFMDATSVSFGSEITVNGFIVDSPSQITVNISIENAASLGPRHVSVTTSRGTISKAGGFWVMQALPIPPPAAEFTANSTSGVAPLAVEFNDQSIGDVTSWSWDFDTDGTVDSTERNPSHTYGTVGDYTVSLTVTGPGGSDTETKTDYIHVTSFESALDQIQAEVSWWRGLPFLEEVNWHFMTQEEYREGIITEFASETDEINTTQELWSFLDLMGQGQDLYGILVNLYSEGTAGFYDYELKELYVISSAEEMGPVEKVTFAHEYAHALQDQHFDLGSFLPSPEGDSDVYVAAQSLMEGDAEFLQWVYYWGSLDDAERVAYDQEMAEYDGSAFEAAPQILQEQFLFPYTSGADFVAALWQEGGWDAVNQAYSDPPQSTEQILHPEKYFNRDEPQAVSMPDLASALGTGWTQLDSDIMGELGMKVYLEAFVDTEEAAAAAGWDGDRYVFLKDAEGKRVLALSSVWDSVWDASEFFNTYIDYRFRRKEERRLLDLAPRGRRNKVVANGRIEPLPGSSWERGAHCHGPGCCCRQSGPVRIS
jgi:PKD repeat protein